MTPEDEECIEKVRKAIKFVQSVRVTESDTLSEEDDGVLGSEVRDIWASCKSEFQDLVEPGQKKPKEVQIGLGSPGIENLDKAYQLLTEVQEDQASLSTVTLNLDFRSAPVAIRNIYLKYTEESQVRLVNQDHPLSPCSL